MQLVHAKMNDAELAYTITDKLKSMKVSKTQALTVGMTEAPSIRTLISKIHRETKFRFETKKSHTGILVWRIA